ncbi:MAG: hypothetical protein LBJ59_03225 [Zoogloeaceae bacterium]|jgi:hypothetical protein|nr:hypothetical protein [Zoogloeaceae bacterium]
MTSFETSLREALAERAFAASPAGQVLTRIENNLHALYGRRMSPRAKGRIERVWMRLFRKCEIALMKGVSA